MGFRIDNGIRRMCLLVKSLFRLLSLVGHQSIVIERLNDGQRFLVNELVMEARLVRYNVIEPLLDEFNLVGRLSNFVATAFAEEEVHLARLVQLGKVF